MRVILLLCILAGPGRGVSQQENKLCLEWYGDSVEKFDKINLDKTAACGSKLRQEKNAEDLAELRDFLKHNPRYRVPGQSLNRCWGKPREMPFESAYIKVDKTGFEAGVNYKDTLPAGCYENAPWDNRDAKK